MKRRQTLNEYQQKFEATVKESSVTASIFKIKPDSDVSDAIYTEQLRLANQWMRTTAASLQELQIKFQNVMDGIE